MHSQRDRFEAYYRLPCAKEPIAEKAVLAAADAFDAASGLDDISQEHLSVIVKAVSHPSSKISENCLCLLCMASERWPVAGEAIRTMLRERHAHVRFNAICCLGEKSPANLIDEVLKVGLTDKSARVRWKAADTDSSLNRRLLIPDMEQALARETNVNARESIEFSLHFLRDGFRVRQQDDGSYSVSVRLFSPNDGRHARI